MPTTIELDYPTASRNEPRYTREHPNKRIEQILAQNHLEYERLLDSFQKYFVKLSRVEPTSMAESAMPTYINGFLPGLDAVALYCLLAESDSQTYMEIGSGNSTKFARRSISDNRLKTKIISIDPQPRADVETICDEVIRRPVEDIDLCIFDQLQARDILFIDNSHRCFMNSDVTICFLEILPRLASGVLIEIHDVFWPCDYPAAWCGRYYNEQYLLGALLANGLTTYEIVLPCYYVSLQSDLALFVEKLWRKRDEFCDIERHGGSFWMRKR